MAEAQQTEQRMRKRDRRERPARDRFGRRRRIAQRACAAKRPSGGAPNAWPTSRPRSQYTLDLLVRVPDLDGVLPRAAEDAGRRRREPRGRRLADRRRQAVLRLLDGAPVGEVLHATRRWATYFPRRGAWRSSCFDYKHGLGRRRSNIAATIPGCRTRARVQRRARPVLDSRRAADARRQESRMDHALRGRGTRGRLVVAHRAGRSDRAARGAGAASEPALRAEAGSRNAARRSSRSATASRATFTTTWRRASARS